MESCNFGVPMSNPMSQGYGLSRNGMLGLWLDGVDIIGLSVSDRPNVNPLLYGILYTDPDTVNPDPAATALASPLLNKTTMVGGTKGVAVYPLGTDSAILAKATKALGGGTYATQVFRCVNSNPAVGSDSNDGLSPSTAFLTLAKAISVAQADQFIALANASTWKEPLIIPNNGVKIISYGDANVAAPIIDGADTVLSSEWLVSGTYPNTYRITRTSLGANGEAYQGVWEDGAKLAQVASAEICNNTPGSFYYPNTASGVSYTLYAHPTGTTNPATNGRTYEVCARLQGIYANSTRESLEIHGPLTIKRAAHHNGSLNLGSPGAYAADVAVSGGKMHNIYTDSGRLYRATTPGGCSGSGSSDMVVNAYPASADKSMYYEDCIGGVVGATIGAGFFAHANTLGRIHYKGCKSLGGNGGFSSAGGNGETIIYEDVEATATTTATSSDDQFGAAGAKIYIINSKLLGNDYAIAQSNKNAGSSLYVYGSYIESTTNRAVSVINSASFLQHFDSSVLSAAAASYGFSGQNSPLNVMRNNCIMMHSGNGWYNAALTGSEYAGDHNVYYDYTKLAHNFNGQAYTTLAAWRTATGYDANSVSADPLFTSDPSAEATFATMDFTTQAGSPAKTLFAGITDKPASYTAPAWVDAEVAAMVNY